MKTLAVRQPWATYIAEHTKTIEVRTWRTHYRGPLLIVASGRPHKHADEDGRVWTLPTQVQVCLVDLVDVRPMTRADEAHAHVAWSPGLFAWRLANPRHVRPVAHRGRLNIYSTPDESVTLLNPDAHYLDHLETTMKMLMNIPTGSVDTEENWLAEMPTWETSTNGRTPQEQFDALVEVIQDENGDWVEA